MIEEARIAYKILYAACEKVVESLNDASADNSVSFLSSVAEDVFGAMSDAELASPFGSEGNEEPVADYCRTCGRPIQRTDESNAYCETCSRSTKVQTDESNPTIADDPIQV